MPLPDNPFFQAVRRHADSMLDYGRDPSPDSPSPLFGGVVDPLRRCPAMYQMIPPPGVRINDVSSLGNNLMHDVPLLETLLALSQATGDGRYAQVVEDLFAFYPKNCPYPGTGLFPWGEHAQWAFAGKRPWPNCVIDPFMFEATGAIIHEHLRFAPAWFWERMWASDSGAVLRFCRGLDRHLMNRDTFEHNRHAPLTEYAWNELPYQGPGKDFARHAGFFIFDCCFAWKKSGEVDLLDWARRKLGYHLRRRHPDGIVKGCIRTPAEEGEGQHDSLALSTWDAGQYMGEETPEGREFLDMAKELFDARAKKMAAAPFDAGALDLAGVWRYGYGGAVPGEMGVRVPLQAWKRTGEQAFADVVAAVAERLADSPPPPDGLPVVAGAFLNNLDVPLAAYDVTGDKRHLARAQEVGRWALERLATTGLFVGAVNVEYFGERNIMFSLPGCVNKLAERPGFYFSNTGTPELVRQLLRLALLSEGEADLLGTSDHYR